VLGATQPEKDEAKQETRAKSALLPAFPCHLCVRFHRIPLEKSWPTLEQNRLAVNQKFPG
jgi:hypothetical protein